jgi:hypothetical protein
MTRGKASKRVEVRLDKQLRGQHLFAVLALEAAQEISHWRKREMRTVHGRIHHGKGGVQESAALGVSVNVDQGTIGNWETVESGLALSLIGQVRGMVQHTRTWAFNDVLADKASRLVRVQGFVEKCAEKVSCKEDVDLGNVVRFEVIEEFEHGQIVELCHGISGGCIEIHWPLEDKEKLAFPILVTQSSLERVFTNVFAALRKVRLLEIWRVARNNKLYVLLHILRALIDPGLGQLDCTIIAKVDGVLVKAANREIQAAKGQCASHFGKENRRLALGRDDLHRNHEKSYSGKCRNVELHCIHGVVAFTFETRRDCEESMGGHEDGKWKGLTRVIRL